MLPAGADQGDTEATSDACDGLKSPQRLMTISAALLTRHADFIDEFSDLALLTKKGLKQRGLIFVD
jgi:hypothetical protein